MKKITLKYNWVSKLSYKSSKNIKSVKEQRLPCSSVCNWPWTEVGKKVWMDERQRKTLKHQTREAQTIKASRWWWGFFFLFKVRGPVNSKQHCGRPELCLCIVCVMTVRLLNTFQTDTWILTVLHFELNFLLMKIKGTQHFIFRKWVF